MLHENIILILTATNISTDIVPIEQALRTNGLLHDIIVRMLVMRDFFPEPGQSVAYIASRNLSFFTNENANQKNFIIITLLNDNNKSSNDNEKTI